MEKTDSEVQLIGFLVENDRDKIETKRPDKLAEFDEKIGRKRISPTSFYSVEDTLRYQQVACEILFGEYNEENVRKMGQIDAELVQSTQFGKIAFSLFIRELKSGLMNFPKLVNSVYRGISVEATEKGEKEVELVFQNDPYLKTYFQGLFEGGMKILGLEGEVQVVDEPGDKRRFTVKWE